MLLLPDTFILLWWLTDDSRLSSRAGALLAERGNRTFVSSVSLWEIAIKSQLGRLTADVDEVRVTALDGGFEPLPFTLEHAGAVAQLPLRHRDPFDRALIAQALIGPLALLTHDQSLSVYGKCVLHE